MDGPIPGPRALEVIAKDERYLATSTKTLPLAVRRAEGSRLEDVDGNRYIDFTCGWASPIWVTATPGWWRPWRPS